LTRWLDQFFQLSQQKTTIRPRGGRGTDDIFTMAYIVAVNPAILKNAGIPGSSVTATILTAIFGTLVMAFMRSVHSRSLLHG